MIVPRQVETGGETDLRKSLIFTNDSWILTGQNLPAMIISHNVSSPTRNNQTKPNSPPFVSLLPLLTVSFLQVLCNEYVHLFTSHTWCAQCYVINLAKVARLLRSALTTAQAQTKKVLLCCPEWVTAQKLAKANIYLFGCNKGYCCSQHSFMRN